MTPADIYRATALLRRRDALVSRLATLNTGKSISVYLAGEYLDAPARAVVSAALSTHIEAEVAELEAQIAALGVELAEEIDL